MTTNKEAKHTPGTWKYGSRSALGIEIEAEDGKRIGVSYLPKKVSEKNTVEQVWSDESAANARLIAAAPELLWALENLVDATEKFAWPKGIDQKSFIDAAKSAIAKAEGK
jgi:hypothetical protein